MLHLLCRGHFGELGCWLDSWLDGFIIVLQTAIVLLTGQLTLCSPHWLFAQVARCVPWIDHYGPAHVHPQPPESPEAFLDCQAVWRHPQSSRGANGRANGSPWVSQSASWRRVWGGTRWLFPVWRQATWTWCSQRSSSAGPLPPGEGTTVCL